MGSALKYIVDDSGNKSPVLNKKKVIEGIQKGLKEVKRAKNKAKKLQTLREFLNERL